MNESGDEGSLPFLLINFSELECRAGNWDRAARYAAEGCRIGELGEQNTMISATLFGKARVEAHLGLVDSARTNAEAGLALAQATGNTPAALMNLSVLGFLELSLRNVAAAHAHLGPIAERLAAAGVGEPGVLRFLSDEIEALIALGELDFATVLIDQLQERGLTLDRPWARAVGARGRGLLLAALGDMSAAREAMQRALHEHERLAEPFELGRTLLAMGNVQRRRQEKRAARDTLEQSVAVFDRLGARLWSEHARSELRRIGGRNASRGALTETEQRIVDLVAIGHTNHEVAEELYLSEKTVAWNLSNVYRKLGLRSRTELAARARH